MTPPKRQKANVKKILDNPVQSKAQEILRPKKEGFFGWLSYLGWSLMVFPMGNAIIEYFLGVIGKYISFPWSDSDSVILLICLFNGLILTLITMIKHKHLPSKFTLISLFALAVIGEVIMPMTYTTHSGTSVLFSVIIVPLIIFWIYSLCWYLYYFYKKSKEGYRYVWLKVLLFTFLPFLSFIGAEVGDLSFDITDRAGNSMMGDVLTIPEYESWRAGKGDTLDIADRAGEVFY